MITLYNIVVDCNVILPLSHVFCFCFIILLCLMPDDLNSDLLLGYSAATQ